MSIDREKFREALREAAASELNVEQQVRLIEIMGKARAEVARNQPELADAFPRPPYDASVKLANGNILSVSEVAQNYLDSWGNEGVEELLSD